MGGFSSITGDETIVNADNASFDGTERGGKMTTNGQLWIGSTAARHVKLGTITSPGNTITIGYSSPNITLDVSGGAAVAKLTPNENFDGSAATPIVPQAGNINVFGSTPAVATVTETYNSNGLATGNLEVEHRAWLTPLVVDPSTTPGSRGTFSTIASAITAASSGQDIFIRSGTYTENLTLKAGVNLIAFMGDADTPNVTILGKCTATFAGTCTLSNIRLKTNSDFCLSVTGSSATIVNLRDCYIDANNNTSIQFSSSSAAFINLFDCRGNIDTTGIAYFTHTSSGAIAFDNCIFANDGASTTASTITSNAGGSVGIRGGYFNNSVTTSGTNAVLEIINAEYHGDITHNSTLAVGNNLIEQSSITAYANDTALTIGAGASMIVVNTTLFSNNANAVAGSGTLKYGGVVFDGSSSTIQGTITQSPLPFSVPQGGTGDSSFTAYAVLAGGTTSTGALQQVSGLGSSGQVLTSNGAGALPTWQPASSGTMTWTDEGTNFSPAANNGYFCTAALTATLPASPNQGDKIAFICDTGSNVTVTANTGQKIRLGSTISAAAGTAVSSTQGNALTIVYRSTGTTWITQDSVGIWAIT